MSHADKFDAQDVVKKITRILDKTHLTPESQVKMLVYAANQLAVDRMNLSPLQASVLVAENAIHLNHLAMQIQEERAKQKAFPE